MTDGWVKLWRKSIDSGLIKNHNVWIFWTYCLMKANHEKDYKQVVGFQEIILHPGQFIFGRKVAAKETGLSEQKIRTCLAFLKKYKNITIKSTNKFSIISIIKWHTYQANNITINQQSNQHITSRQPASNQQVTTNKNLRTKEPKNNKKTKAKKVFAPPTIEEVIHFFYQNSYSVESAKTAFHYYADGNPPWTDSKGNEVRSWKQKMRAVWFKPENKAQDCDKKIDFSNAKDEYLKQLASAGNVVAFEELRKRGKAI